MAPPVDNQSGSYNYYGTVFNNYDSVGNQAGEQNVQGNLNSIYPTGRVRAQDDYSLGVNLGDAPTLDSSFFIGRDSDLESMREILDPKSHPADRAIVVLGGVGGIGKTQTAIAFAKRYHSLYSSIFWLNAASETTLKRSLRQIAQRVLGPDEAGKYDDEMTQAHVLNWMSERDNDAWLMILDNHDEPESYSITQYFPYASHGSIIITSRMPDQINGKRIPLQAVSNDEDEINILESRSGRRNLASDPGAQQLVKRLGGLPLALATAGASLKQSTLSPAEYMKLYEAQWKILPKGSYNLPEYQGRSLFTTWNVSFIQLQRLHPHAARLLEFIAYLDHQMLWYELLQAGHTSDSPPWFMDVTGDRSKFEEAMRTLVSFGLAQVQHETATYSLHACVHDWTMHGLNGKVKASFYRLAFDCVTGFSQTATHLSEFRLLKLVPHAIRLVQDGHQRELFQEAIFPSRFFDILRLTQFLHLQDQRIASQHVLEWIRTRCEDGRCGDKGISLIVSGELGYSYAGSGRLVEAEHMFRGVIARYDEAYCSEPIKEHVLMQNDFRSQWGEIWRWAKSTVHINFDVELARVYDRQGRFREAEPMLRQTLAKTETTHGPDSRGVLYIVETLMRVVFARGDIAEARTLALRARTLCKKISKTGKSTFQVLEFLGRLYVLTNRPTKAIHYCQEMIRLGGHILNRAPSSLIINALSKAFAIKLKLTNATNSEVRSCIDRLNRFAEEHGQKLFITYAALSQGLMSIGDLENAGLAYQYGVVVNRLQIGDNEICVGCRTGVKAKQRLHMCRQCFDLILCEECMGQYAGLGNIIPYCSGHEFLNVDLTDLPELNRTNIELWHQSIGKKYGANQD